MGLLYKKFDAAQCGFPRPRVPLLPLPHWGEWSRAGSGEWTSSFAGRDAASYQRGRYALFSAYRLAGVGPRRGLLVPSYHCPTMLDPALRLAAPIVCYPLSPRLEPDVSRIADLLDTSASEFAAVLATHYFGWPGRFDALAELCAQRKIFLIEDCAHAYFGHCSGRPPGSVGDYAIASPGKFFPVAEGGVLITNRRGDHVSSRQAPASLAAEFGLAARLAVDSVGRRRNRLRWSEIGMVDEQLRCVLAKTLPPAWDGERNVAGPSANYRPQCEHRPATRFSRWLIRHQSWEWIARRRRQRYRDWLDRIAGIPHCRPLYPDLPDDCVPYMFPLYIDFPETHFHLLKRLGMPIWRWDDLAVSACPVAGDYRLHLLQLPCHQDLYDEELDWMRAVLSAVMATEPTVRQS